MLQITCRVNLGQLSADSNGNAPQCLSTPTPIDLTVFLRMVSVLGTLRVPSKHAISSSQAFPIRALFLLLSYILSSLVCTGYRSHALELVIQVVLPQNSTRGFSYISVEPNHHSPTLAFSPSFPFFLIHESQLPLGLYLYPYHHRRRLRRCPLPILRVS